MPLPSTTTSLPLPHMLAGLRVRFSATRTRAVHQLALWIEHARSSLGIRRGRHIGTCYFKELTAQRLGRALAARRGGGSGGTRAGGGAPGFKDFRVTFADGTKMVIRCTRQRCYADLMGDDGLHRYARVGHMLRPGSRILEICSAPLTTGYTGAWLARMTGESGGVVSIIPDEQGARFAAQRYDFRNLSIEPIDAADDHGAAAIAQALAGETGGAFHAVIHLGLPTQPRHRDALMRELWRVLAPGGWMLAGVKLTDDPADEAVQSLRRHLAGMGQVIEPSPPEANADASPVLDVLLRKRAEEGE